MTTLHLFLLLLPFRLGLTMIFAFDTTTMASNISNLMRTIAMSTTIARVTIYWGTHIYIYIHSMGKTSDTNCSQCVGIIQWTSFLI